MKGHRSGAVVVLVLLGSILFFSPAVPRACAQFVPSSKHLTLDAGYAAVKGEQSNRWLDGYGFRATFEQSDWGGDFAGGGSFLVLRADDTTAQGVNLNYGNFMATVFGKWFFGPPRVRFNLVGSFGIQLGRLERSGDLEDDQGNVERTTITDEDSGFTAGLGAGAYLFLSDSLFANAGYDFQWLGNSFYQNGVLHFFRLGIGFQYD